MAKTVKKWIVQTVLEEGQSFTADEAALCDALKRWGQMALEFYACGRAVKVEVLPEEVYIENEVGPKMADAWQAGREHARAGERPPGIGPGWVPCPSCNGDGVVGGFVGTGLLTIKFAACGKCNGTSWVKADAPLSAPPGIHRGQTFSVVSPAAKTGARWHECQHCSGLGISCPECDGRGGFIVKEPTPIDAAHFGAREQ